MSAALDFGRVVEEAVAQASGSSAPESVRARFAREPELDERETEKQGRPVFKMEEFIYLRPPGWQYEERFRAQPNHYQRFARAYHWFLDVEKEPTTGYPLDQWNQITRLQCEELKHAGVKTVEDLANWDLVARPVEKSRAALVALAQQFLAGQDAKDARISELEAEIESLKANPSEPKRRGRPPKAAAETPLPETAYDASLDGPGGG